MDEDHEVARARREAHERSQTPWTIEDLDDDARQIARCWAVATEWHWVDAVAWVASQDTAVMAVLAGFRDYAKRLYPSFDVGESATREVLRTIIAPEQLPQPARLLRAWCAGGALAATSISSGLTLMPADWKSRRVPIVDKLPHVLLPADAVRRRVSDLASSKGNGAHPQVSTADFQTEIKRVASAFDKAGLAVRDIKAPNVLGEWDSSFGRPPKVAAVTDLMRGKPRGRPPLK
jgi:hypothetical protein